MVEAKYEAGEDIRQTLSGKTKKNGKASGVSRFPNKKGGAKRERSKPSLSTSTLKKEIKEVHFPFLGYLFPEKKDQFLNNLRPWRQSVPDIPFSYHSVASMSRKYLSIFREKMKYCVQTYYPRII